MVLKIMRVRRLDVVGTALLSTLASAIVGLVLGILFLLSSLFMSSLFMGIPLVGARIAEAWTSAGVSGLLVSPILFAALGFIVGLIVTFLANVALKRMDGLRVEVDLDADPPLGDMRGLR